MRSLSDVNPSGVGSSSDALCASISKLNHYATAEEFGVAVIVYVSTGVYKQGRAH
jgi:hypothetical protein